MYNYIKEILEIKDKNIEITGEIKKEKIKGQTTFVAEGKLTYDIEYCPCCGCKNEKHTVVKDGFLNTEIKMLRISEKPTKLKLKKQRYKCKNCERKFTAETKIVDKYCQISKILKVTVLSNLKEIKSNKTIAKEQYISESTIIRILQGSKKYLETNKYKNLPEHLCFDEIKSTKDAENKMSFVYADAQTGNLIDIVDGRTYNKLKNYFIAIPRNIRKKVKTICMDIYPPYMKLIKEIFPKAEIIIDRFHIVQNINREFNKYRIQLMNKFKNKERHIYTKLKIYWRLLLKEYSEINYQKTHYSRTFGRTVSNKEVLDYILSIDQILANNYKIMQEIRHALKTRNIELFKETIGNNEDTYSKGMIKAIKTIKKYEDYMINSMRYNYSNGVLEGINNKIKLIKRVSYGCSSFYNFRLRILIVFRLLANYDKKNDIKNNLMQQNSAA